MAIMTHEQLVVAQARCAVLSTGWQFCEEEKPQLDADGEYAHGTPAGIYDDNGDLVFEIPAGYEADWCAQNAEWVVAARTELPSALELIQAMRQRLKQVFGPIRRAGLPAQEIDLPDDPAAWDWLTFCQHERLDDTTINVLLKEISILSVKLDEVLTGHTDPVVRQVQQAYLMERSRASQAVERRAKLETERRQLCYQNANLATALEGLLGAYQPTEQGGKDLKHWGGMVLEQNRVKEPLAGGGSS